MTGARPRLAAFVLAVAVAPACTPAGRPASVVESPAPLATTAPAQAPAQARRPAPRWEALTRLSGTGRADSDPFSVAPESLQWRVRWTCAAGALRIEARPAAGPATPLVDASCPREGDGFSRQKGELRLVVEASGPWDATVEQQLETPIEEPPLAEMTGATLLGQGSFYPMLKPAKGGARLYRLPDGRRALRFEGFETFESTELYVWLGKGTGPRTQAEATAGLGVEVGPLKSTLGSQNYLVPDDAPPDAYQSVIVWSSPLSQAFTAASLAP